MAAATDDQVGGVDREVSPYLRAPRMLPYWSWLGGEIFKANVAVLKLALKPDIDLTPRLIGGAALFGIGWGVAGLCPGPGIAALVIEPASAAIFVAAMLAGMALVRLFEGAGA